MVLETTQSMVHPEEVVAELWPMEPHNISLQECTDNFLGPNNKSRTKCNTQALVLLLCPLRGQCPTTWTGGDTSLH